MDGRHSVLSSSVEVAAGLVDEVLEHVEVAFLGGKVHRRHRVLHPRVGTAGGGCYDQCKTCIESEMFEGLTKQLRRAAVGEEVKVPWLKFFDRFSLLTFPFHVKDAPKEILSFSSTPGCCRHWSWRTFFKWQRLGQLSYCSLFRCSEESFNAELKPYFPFLPPGLSPGDMAEQGRLMLDNLVS